MISPPPNTSSNLTASASNPSLTILQSLGRHFATYPDSRMPGRVKHLLSEVLLVAFIAILSGCDTFTDMGLFAKAKLDWLRTIIPLQNGPPSHDIFRNVFLMVKPSVFSALLDQWAGQQPVKRIMIDGKSLRGSDSPATSQKMLHILRAWVSESGISVCHVLCGEKSNEIDALPKLLDSLELEGTLTSIDAMGTQTETTETIVNAKGDYILALKKNHPGAYKTVTDRFVQLDEFFVKHNQLASMVEEHKTVTLEHGRYLERICQVTDLDGDWFKKDWKWHGLKCVVRMERRGHRGGSQKEALTSEVHYYLTSCRAEAERLAKEIRAHWGVENSCHYILDVTFREDDCQVRDRKAAQNLSIMRGLALKALRDFKPKLSIRIKRKQAGFDDSFREEALNCILHNFHA